MKRFIALIQNARLSQFGGNDRHLLLMLYFSHCLFALLGKSLESCPSSSLLPSVLASDKREMHMELALLLSRRRGVGLPSARSSLVFDRLLTFPLLPLQFDGDSLSL